MILTAIGNGQQIDGYQRVWWQSSNFSPGDGTHQFTPELADKYVASLPDDAVPCLDMEIVREPTLPKTDVTGKRRDDLILQAATLLRERLGDKPIVSFGIEFTPNRAKSGMMNYYQTKQEWLEANTRCRSQLKLMGILGAAFVSGYISDPPEAPYGDSSDRDIRIAVEKIKVIRASRPSVPVYVWVSSRTTHHGYQTLGDAVIDKLLKVYREWADFIVVWNKDKVGAEDPIIRRAA